MKSYHTTTFEPDPFPPSNRLHGGKGAGLLEMAKAGLPVPEALILTTEAWQTYRATGALPAVVKNAIKSFIKKFPDALFSVRSGAPVSMPGMMDTILNVGVDPEAAYHGSYRRFVTGWLDVVHLVPKPRIAELFKLVEARAAYTGSTYSSPQVNPHRFNKLTAGIIGYSENLKVPVGRYDQIASCVEAVFNSWDTPRARAYRKMHDIPEDMGTACVVQRMVMGTAAGVSMSGVMFTRDPATGEPRLTGEYAMNCQGEEVVSGEITPTSISELAQGTEDERSVFVELVELGFTLEKHFDEVQDIEFTVEKGKLYVLQTRTAKMSAKARIVTACDLSRNRPYDEAIAYVAARVSRASVAATMVPVVDTTAQPVTTGLAAAPGAISGTIVFRTTPLHKINKTCILVCEETSPDDFSKMAASGGIYTSTGGFTCHSAVVARGIGKPAVVGDSNLTLNEVGDACKLGGDYGFLSEGDTITIDGSTGRVWVGEHPVKKSQPPRILYERLFELASNKFFNPVPVWFLECAMGDRVALTLDPGDLIRVDAQIARADRLKQAGKTIGFIIEQPGFGEDLIIGSAQDAFAELVKEHGPDLEGELLLGGEGHVTLAGLANMKTAAVDTVLVDLLDLLDGGA